MFNTEFVKPQKVGLFRLKTQKKERKKAGTERIKHTSIFLMHKLPYRTDTHKLWADTDTGKLWLIRLPPPGEKINKLH